MDRNQFSRSDGANGLLILELSELCALWRLILGWRVTLSDLSDLCISAFPLSAQRSHKFICIIYYGNTGKIILDFK